MAQPQEERRHYRKQNQAPARAKAKNGIDLAAKLRADADDPDEVRKALDDAAGMSRNLWLAFLTFGTYLAVAVGSVKHRDLFLESPVKLPLLNVDLPLVAFFWVAPILLLIFHAYLLLNLRLMVDNVHRYNAMMRDAKLKSKQDDDFRLLLTNFPFVQLLAGASDTRRGLVGWVLRGIVWITVVLAPLVLLLVMQLQFLPYHSSPVTWLHRCAIIADLVLIWLFWPKVMLSDDAQRHLVLAARGAGLLLTFLLVVFAVFIATFPGEPHDRNTLAMTAWMPTAWNFPTSRKEAYDRAYHKAESEADGDESNTVSSSKSIWLRLKALLEPKSPYQLLFLGNVNEVTGGRDSLWSNTLVLSDEDFVDDDKLSKMERTVPLRGRDLRQAVLVRTDLRKADFTGANLNDADLSHARLDEARFGCGTIGGNANFASPFDTDKAYYIESTDYFPWPQDGCTWLLRAKFDGVSLRSAYLQSARLQGAQFEEAQLQEANFYGARLQGVNFRKAHLEGASLAEAWVQGASFPEAQLQGALLDHAWLQGANLNGANLDGASLNFAWLHGASLREASAHGTSFVRTQLQGADLTQIQLVGANLSGALAWRARLDKEPEVNINTQPARLEGSYFGYLKLTRVGPRDYFHEEETLDQDIFNAMNLNAIRGGMLNRYMMKTILDQLTVLDPSQPDPDYWPSSYSLLSMHVDSKNDIAYLQTVFASEFGRIACQAKIEPYALRGMLQNGVIGHVGHKIKIVIEMLDDSKACPGAAVLTEPDRLAIRDLQSGQ